MKFIKRNINPIGRNSLISFVSKSSGNTNVIAGDYLPAISNGDGTYTVDLSTVTFNGNIVAAGEVCAYSSGTTSGTTSGETSGGTSCPITIVIDNSTLKDKQILVYDVTSKTWINADNTCTGSTTGGTETTEIVTELSKLKDVQLSNLADNDILQYSSSSKKWLNKKTHSHSNLAILNTISQDTINGWNDKYSKKEINDKLSGITNSLNTHIGDTTKHITADERNRWNDTYTTSQIDGKISGLAGDISTLNTNLGNHINDKVRHITDDERAYWNNKLDKSVWDKAFYFDRNDNLHAKLNLIGEKEICAYGSGTTSGSTGLITIVDNVNSTATDAALSANMGKYLNDKIENITTGGQIELTDYYNKTQIDDFLADKSNTGHTHSQYLTQHQSLSNYYTKDDTNTHITKATSGITSSLNTHIGDTTKHITSSERNRWNDTYTTSNIDGKFSTVNSNLNTHIGDKVRHITDDERNRWNDTYTTSNIDGKFSTVNSNLNNHINDTTKHITDDERNRWNAKLDKTVWDKAFYFDKNDNLHAKLNLIGEKEVSAYGSGETTSTGLITIVDNVNSTATDAALSANMGRYLYEQIENNGSLDSKNYYNKTQIDDFLADKSDTGHTHSQYLTQHQSLSNYYKKDETNSQINKATSGITNSLNTHINDGVKHITSNERNRWNDTYTTSQIDGKFTSANSNLNNHINDSVKHITTAERNRWNDTYTTSNIDGKFSTVNSNLNNHINDSVKHITTAERNRWNDTYTTSQIDGKISGLAGDISTLDTNLGNHINDTTKHITADERNRWNAKLDKSVWDKAFYFDKNDNLHAKLNLVGDNEISAYGSGTTAESGSGAITIVDSVRSTSKDAALSANMGKYLNDRIDAINVPSLGNYYTADETDNKIEQHSYSKYDSDNLYQKRGTSPLLAVHSYSGSHTASDADDVILASGNLTITLPTTVSVGKKFYIKGLNGNITIQTSGNNLIDQSSKTGFSSRSLNDDAYQVIKINYNQYILFNCN